MEIASLMLGGALSHGYDTSDQLFVHIINFCSIYLGSPDYLNWAPCEWGGKRLRPSSYLTPVKGNFPQPTNAKEKRLGARPLPVVDLEEGRVTVASDYSLRGFTARERWLHALPYQLRLGGCTLGSKY